MGQLLDLTHLDLRNNRLTGEIPAELGGLTNLQWVYLSGNELTGCIPEGLRAVAKNDLSLPFCDCATGRAVANATNNLGLVSDCEALLAARDTLAGSATLDWSASTPIADWEGVTVGGMPRRVTGLRLNDRQLSGTIPPELGSLSNLQYLWLSSNQLTGEIPAELGGLSNLRRLDLSGNELSGEIPAELGSLSNLRKLDLSGNELSGEIPSELGNLSSLGILDLDSNKLSGEIPSELGNLCQSPGSIGQSSPGSLSHPVGR